MFTAAFVIISISYFHTKKSIEKIEKRCVDNTLHSIELSVEDNYNYLLDSRYKYINNYRTVLKRNVEWMARGYEPITDEIQNILNDYYIDSKRNVGQKDGYDKKFGGNVVNAHTRFINIIDAWFNLPYDKEKIQWMIIDKKGSILVTTIPALRLANINNFIELDGKPFEGRYYGKSLSHAGQSVVFQYRLQKEKQEKDSDLKLGYFFPIKNEITISAFIDIDKFTKKDFIINDEIKKSLYQILSKIKISELGFSFIFDKNQNIIIDPHGIFNKFKAEDRKNILNKIVRKREDNRIDFPGINGEHFVYTKYFDGFDGWYISIAIPVKEIVKPAKHLAVKQLLVISFIFVICILLVVLVIYIATAPLQILSNKIEKVPDHDFICGDHAELIQGLPISTKNEIGKLAQTFAFMINELSVSIKQLVETTATNERIESELNVARDIQLGTLPTDFSFEPERKALDIYAYLIPAKEIGGDLYDFFFIDENHLCLTIGDVAGKGVPAALFMVIAKKLINNNARTGGKNISPAEIMNQVNEIIYQDNKSSTFISLFIGILNVKTGELRYANGGHVPPIFTDCNNDPYYKKDLSGPVVGVITGIKYKEITMALQSGGAIFLCTDGVTEAMNETDEMFGDPRLLEDFVGIKDKSCKEAVEAILHEVRIHAGTAPQSDDIAMMMVRWGVNEESKNELSI